MSDSSHHPLVLSSSAVSQVWMSESSTPNTHVSFLLFSVELWLWHFSHSSSLQSHATSSFFIKCHHLSFHFKASLVVFLASRLIVVPSRFTKLGQCQSSVHLKNVIKFNHLLPCYECTYIMMVSTFWWSSSTLEAYGFLGRNLLTLLVFWLKGWLTLLHLKV